MTLQTQRETLEVLAEIWALAPDVRLGQLLENLGFLGEAHLGTGLAYLDDDQLLAIMYRHRSELQARLHGATSQPLPLTALTTSVSGSSTVPEAMA